MERPGGALRYAELEATTSANVVARDERVHADADEFDGARGTTINSSAMNGGKSRDGSRSLARLQARMDARAKRAELRDALDLIRQQELLDNLGRREARTRQRRWYVLGRVIDEVMAADAALRDRVMSVCNDYLVRADERGLLGLRSSGTRSE